MLVLNFTKCFKKSWPLKKYVERGGSSHLIRLIVSLSVTWLVKNSISEMLGLSLKNSLHAKDAAKSQHWKELWFSSGNYSTDSQTQTTAATTKACFNSTMQRKRFLKIKDRLPSSSKASTCDGWFIGMSSDDAVDAERQVYRFWSRKRRRPRHI